MAKIKTVNPYKELINLLNKPHIQTKQLLDGHIFLYNQDYLMASFYYYGGTTIFGLVLNTKNYIGHSFYHSMKLYDEYLSSGTALGVLLKERFPMAKECNDKMQYAYEYSIVEWLLNSPTSMIEVSPTQFGYAVAIVNNEAFTSCSFRYATKGKEIKKLWLRYSSRVKTVQLDRIIVPRCRWEFMDQLIDRTFTPIVD